MEKTLTPENILTELGFSKKDIEIINQLEANGGGLAPLDQGAMGVRFWTCMEIVGQRFFDGLDPDGFLTSVDELDEMSRAEFYMHFVANIAAMSKEDREAICHMARDFEDELDDISKRRAIMESARKIGSTN